ncbi:sugar O-acetyltransferase [Aliikangiella maris]|uniref:Sugar O-acetyltransferase n=2 Tax=Aliikangiella maris TaxID=3162458 RepID=A0ABV3MLY1_9GAMM
MPFNLPDLNALTIKQPFDSLTPELRQQRQKTHELCRNFNRAPSKGHLKKVVNNFACAGENIIIEPGFHCDYGQQIYMGNQIYININCTLLDGGKIYIGDNCLIGPNVQILTINHPISPSERLQKTSLASDVVIGKNVWLGAGAILLPGVIIGDGAVIGAGSVVTRPVAANQLVAGNPAKPITNSTQQNRTL